MKKKIANFMLEQELSQEQVKNGLYNPFLTYEEQEKLKNLLIVDPTEDKIYPHALKLFEFIRKILERENVSDFHIMGQANLMLCLYKVKVNASPIYSPIGGFYEMWESVTENLSKEVKNTDGSVTKTIVFKEVKNADGSITKTDVFKFVKLRKYGY